MKSINFKVVILLFASAAVVAFALVRVWPYVAHPRGSAQADQRAQVAKYVVKESVPSHETGMTDAEVGNLYDRIRRKVDAAFSRLDGNVRPNNTEVSRISAAYADYVVSHRAMSRTQYLENYPHDEPPDGLGGDDPEQADKTWAHSTAWARNGGIDVDSIRVIPRYFRGTEVDDSGSRGVAYYRELSNGKQLAIDGPGGFSVYEVFLGVVVPSFDGKQELELELGVALINDGPQNEWSAVSCQYIGVPTGTFVYTPRP